MSLFVYEYLSVYNMGDKKFPLKKTIVQIKFCVSCPCPFRGTNFRGGGVNFCLGNLTHVQRRKNVEGTLWRTLGRSSK